MLWYFRNSFVSSSIGVSFADLVKSQLYVLKELLTQFWKNGFHVIVCLTNQTISGGFHIGKVFKKTLPALLWKKCPMEPLTQCRFEKFKFITFARIKCAEGGFLTRYSKARVVPKGRAWANITVCIRISLLTEQSSPQFHTVTLTLSNCYPMFFRPVF